MCFMSRRWFDTLEGISSLAWNCYKIGINFREERIDGTAIDKGEEKSWNGGEYDQQSWVDGDLGKIGWD